MNNRPGQHFAYTIVEATTLDELTRQVNNQLGKEMVDQRWQCLDGIRYEGRFLQTMVCVKLVEKQG